ncbi:MAG: hypothetical protein J6M66_10770 [Lachnospiraceae bacterium]|nr:hypothetical protein [Lachnospiraceae bacterium]
MKSISVKKIQRSKNLVIGIMTAFLLTAVLAAGSFTVQAAQIDLPDGTYEIAVTLSGGSGKASVSSPAVMTVQDGQASARIVFSSSHYDYMRVAEQTYYPVNTEGNSTFEIPVLTLDSEMPVVADTTAMSTPHEISYTLYFDSSSLPEQNAEHTAELYAVFGYGTGAVVGIGVLAGLIIFWKGRKKDA